MDLRKITFDVKGEQYSFVVEEDEDAKKKLREHLDVERLPRGVEVVENKLVPLEELSKPDLKRFIKNEQPRLERIQKSIDEGTCSGPGWAIAKNIAKNIGIAESLL